jgi:hypothetical protein
VRGHSEPLSFLASLIRLGSLGYDTGARSPDFRSNWAEEYRLKRPNTLCGMQAVHAHNREAPGPRGRCAVSLLPRIRPQAPVSRRIAEQ